MDDKDRFAESLVFQNRWFRTSLMLSKIGLSPLPWFPWTEKKALRMFVWLSWEALLVRFLLGDDASIETAPSASINNTGSYLSFYRWYWIYAIYWGSTAIVLSSRYEIEYFSLKLTVDNIAFPSLSVYASQYRYGPSTAMICIVPNYLLSLNFW